MSNLLAHSIVKDLAGTSCDLQIVSDVPCSIAVLNMQVQPSIATDLMHFLCLHDIAPDFAITHFGPTEYSGLMDCSSYAVNSLQELQYCLEEIADLSKPKIVVADFAHLGKDENMALALICEQLEDNDAWEEQALLNVTTAWHPAAGMTHGLLSSETQI